MIRCILHAQITVKVFCDISKYKIFELFEYISKNIKTVVKSYDIET